MKSRSIPLPAISVSTRAGSDPDAIEDAHDVYGDWPDILEICERSPVGQCQYNDRDEFRRCIHCGKGDGV